MTRKSEAVRTIRSFIRIWYLGVTNPSRAFADLKREPAPFWGFLAILIRWGGQSLSVGLLALILRVEPGRPARLNLAVLNNAQYHRFALVFTPLFGLGIWLLWGSIVHAAMRTAGCKSDFSHVLNVIGAASLIPAPVIWLWDSWMLLRNSMFAPIAGVVHTAIGLWGLGLLTIGFKRNLDLGTLPAAGLSLLLFAVYVPLAMAWIR